MAWGLYQTYPDEWHILPVDEYDRHIHDESCPCCTNTIVENNVHIVTHSSFDGREALEEAIKLLNPCP